MAFPGDPSSLHPDSTRRQTLPSPGNAPGACPLWLSRKGTWLSKDAPSLHGSIFCIACRVVRPVIDQQASVRVCSRGMFFLLASNAGVARAAAPWHAWVQARCAATCFRGGLFRATPRDASGRARSMCVGRQAVPFSKPLAIANARGVHHHAWTCEFASSRKRAGCRLAFVEFLCLFSFRRRSAAASMLSGGRKIV